MRACAVKVLKGKLAEDWSWYVTGDFDMKRDLEAARGLTLIEVLTLIACLVLLAVLVPVFLRGRDEAPKISCTSNLNNIYAWSLTYSNRRNSFPFAGNGTSVPRAHESLNLLLRSTAGRDLQAMLFTCPTGDQVQATKAPGQTYLELDDDTLSYSWVAKPTRNFGRATNLSSDKYVDGWEGRSGHVRGMMLLQTDRTIRFVDVADLDVDTGLPEGLVR